MGRYQNVQGLKGGVTVPWGVTSRVPGATTLRTMSMEHEPGLGAAAGLPDAVEPVQNK